MLWGERGASQIIGLMEITLINDCVCLRGGVCNYVTLGGRKEAGPLSLKPCQT